MQAYSSRKKIGKIQTSILTPGATFVLWSSWQWNWTYAFLYETNHVQLEEYLHIVWKGERFTQKMYLFSILLYIVQHLWRHGLTVFYYCQTASRECILSFVSRRECILSFVSRREYILSFVSRQWVHFDICLTVRDLRVQHSSSLYLFKKIWYFLERVPNRVWTSYSELLLLLLLFEVRDHLVCMIMD